MRKTLLFIIGFLLSVTIIYAQPTGEIQRLLAGGNIGGDYYGYSVDMDGDYAIVGAHQDDISASNTGCAYIYHFNGSGWDQTAKLTASDAAADDYFGFSVSISGDVAVVGANQDDDKGANSGSVYVFRNSAGVWTQEAKLTASNGQASDNFGCAVAVDGDYFITGATYDDNMGQNSGVSFIFHYSAGVWSQQAILVAADGTAQDYFGSTVDISGDYAIVGTYLKDGIGAESGAAYLYHNNAGVWTQLQKLLPLDNSAGDHFGISVSISGDYAIVGANYDADFGSRSGSAYIYYNNAGIWEQNLKINAFDANEFDEFGVSVSIADDILIVGALKENNTGIACGSSYIFRNNAGVWSSEQKITPFDGIGNLYFGGAVAISSGNCISGVYRDQTDGFYTGTSYFYNRNVGGTNNWGQTEKTLPNDGSLDNQFGSSVSVFGDYAIVGAKGDDDNGANSGSVFIYHNTGTEWEQINRFFASDAAAGDFFGISCSISGSFAMVGATGDDDKGSNSGSVYIFKNTDDVWSQYAKLTAIDGAADDSFGSSVSIDGDFAIIGAYGDDDAGFSSGSVYVFKNTAGVWAQYSKHTGSTAIGGDYFGCSVAISGDYFVAGAYSDDNYGSGSGSAYIFKNTAGVWAQEAFITASDATMLDYFGKSVAISGNNIVIGAYGNDDNGSSSGSAYIFQNNLGVWSQLSKLNASDAAASDYFGSVVSISGNNVLVGAHLDDNFDFNVGATYLFNINGSVVSETNKFIPSDRSAYGGFGGSLCIDGNTAIIGAPSNSTNGNSAGAAFMFGMIPPEITANPVDLSAACIGNTEQFAVAGIGIVDYQWQISTNSGANWANIVENAPYSGSQTETLNVAISASLNNYLYRCVCSNILGDVTSENAEIIIETESPVITSTHSGQSVNADLSCQAMLPDYTSTLTATDNCDLSLSVSQSPVSGTTISGATNLVTLRATDDAGNYTELSFNVAVVDNTNPVITSTHNEQILSGNATCQAILPNYTSTLIANDNCDASLTVTQSPVSGTIISGSSNTVTLTATDNNANFAQITFNVFVEDDTNPTITSTHSNQTVSANASCQALVPSYIASVVATDFCDPSLTISQNPIAGTTISGIANTITLRATDDAGNYAEVSFNLEVVDNSNPTITSVHNDQSLNANATCEASLPDYTSSLIAYDNCDASLSISQTPIAGTMVTGAMNVITLRATDDNSNYSEISFNVSVIDIINPEITSTHSTQTVYGDEECFSIMPDFTSSVVANDNCDSDLTISQIPAGGTTIASNYYIVTLTATDDAGNYDEVSFTLYILDNIAPEITSVHNDQILNDESNCEASLPDYTGDVIASDNCQPFLTINQSPTAGTMISGSSNTVTITVSDGSGNHSQVEFNVVVADNTNPVITSTHNDQTLEAVANCEIALQDYTGDVVANDNCDSDLLISQMPIAGSLVSGVSNNITLTVTDGTGNFSEVSFNVVVEDNTNPTISCVDDQIVNLSEGQNTYTVSESEFNLTTVEDNCGIATIINDFNNTTTLDGAELPIGINTIEWTVTDDNGNVNICSFDVTVNIFVGLESAESIGITVYPNPTHGVLNIVNAKNYIVQITDVSGRQIKNLENVSSDNYSIDITDFPAGVYMLKIFNGSKQVVNRIIVE